MRKIAAAMVFVLLCVGCSAETDRDDVLSGVSVTEPAETLVLTLPMPSTMPSPTPEPLPLEGAIICVDPGHGITPETGQGHRELVSPYSEETKPLYTTGTRGTNLTEEQLNLTIGMQLRDALEELGAEVIMTREVSEITISGIERCEIANKAGADAAIHIHADGNSDPSVHGVSVLVPEADLLGTPSIKDESVRLGELMVDAVAAETGAKNRGTVFRSDITVFNFSEVPSVLVEMGFMTNPEEDARLETTEYQGKLVDGMVRAVVEWYKE